MSTPLFDQLAQESFARYLAEGLDADRAQWANDFCKTCSPHPWHGLKCSRQLCKCPGPWGES